MANAAVAQNIRRLRQDKGLSQENLANMANLSRQCIMNIEGEKNDPRLSNLIDIANALEVSLSDLLEEGPSDVGIRYGDNDDGSTVNAAHFTEFASKATRWTRLYQDMEDITVSEDKLAGACAIAPKKFTLNKILENTSYLRGNHSDQFPKEVARKVRLELNYDCRRTLDICELLEDAGIKLVQRDLGAKAAASGSILTDDLGPAIIINTNKKLSTEMAIFSAAHELGHLVMHSGSYRESIRDASDELIEQQNRQADIFASYLMMPEDIFDKYFMLGRGLSVDVRILNTKAKCKLSYKAVLDRAIQNLSSKNRDIAEQLCDSFTQTCQLLHQCSLNLELSDDMKIKGRPVEYYTKNEPKPLDRIYFVDQRLNDLVRFAVLNSSIRLSKAAEVLEMPLEEVEKLQKAWKMADGPLLSRDIMRKQFELTEINLPGCNKRAS